MEKAKKFQKYVYLCFINYTKALDCVNYNKLWIALKNIAILHLSIDAYTRLTMMTRKQKFVKLEQLNSSKLRKEDTMIMCCHLILLIYLQKGEVGIKIIGRIINNLKNTDCTILGEKQIWNLKCK